MDFRGEEVYKEYYYSNGNLKEGGKYKNPYWKVGIWEYYDENGNLTKREKYNYYGFYNSYYFTSYISYFSCDF